MSEVTASLVVQFAGDGAGILQAEIDSRPAGYNNGRTSFVPGDQPAFLVFKSVNVEVTDVTPSAGNIVALGTGTMQVSELLQFANADEVTLSKPYHSGMVAKWLGTSLGSVALVGDSKLRSASKGVGVLKVTYNARFLAYRLSGVPTVLNGETEYEVLIVVTGEAS